MVEGGTQHTNSTNTWTTTSVRHTEGLVEVEVADISTNVTGRGETDLGVHVGTIHVDLSTSGVDHVDHLLNILIEDTVGGRIGDHVAGKDVLVLVDLVLEVLHVDGTILVVLDLNDLHASHVGGSRVGTVSGLRKKADLSLLLANAVEVLADAEQTRELTGSTRVGLEGHLLEASDVAETRA